MSSRQRYCKAQNNQSPNQGWIRYYNRQEKTRYKRQFRKWLANPDYEIIEQFHRHEARWACN